MFILNVKPSIAQSNLAGVGEYEDAHQAAQHALERIEGTQPWEQAVIEVMITRYPNPAAVQIHVYHHYENCINT